MPFGTTWYSDDDEVGGSPKPLGDIDAAWEQAATVGDEAVGGTVSTPDQDVVDEIELLWG